MNFFGNSATAGSSGSQTDLGSRLYNLKQISIGNEAMVSILPDDNIVQIPVTTFGKSLLSVSTLNGLVGLLNTADTNVQVIDSGTGEINFTLDNALKLAVKNAYTEVMNELRTLSIIPTTTTCDIGSSSNKFRTLHTTDISVSGNIYTSSNTTPMTFAINNSEKMRITSGGNIQVGGASNLPDAFNITSGNIGINSGNDISGIAKITFYHNPWVAGTPSHITGKTAIITEALTSYGQSKLHFCLNNAFNFTHIASVADAKMTILPSGLVGIGTTTPTSTLDINGTTSEVLNVKGSTFPSITLRDTTNTSDATILMRDHGSNKTILRCTGRIDIETPANYGRMTFLTNGNIGINNVAPSEKLDVVGNIKIAGNIVPEATNTRDIGTTGLTFNGVYCNGLIQPSASNAMTFNVNSAERLRITSAGKVGINTNSPQTGLHLNSSNTTGTSILLTSGSNTVRAISAGVVSNEICGLKGPDADGGCLRLSAGGGSSLSLKTFIDMYGYGSDSATNTYMVLGTAGSERIRIASDGKVGINTNSPATMLDVVTNATTVGLQLIGPSEAYDLTTGSAKNQYFPKGIMVNYANQGGAIPTTGCLIDIGAYTNNANTNCFFGAVSGTVGNGPANFVFGRRTGVSTWAETMRIDTSGNLCIGTTTATAGSILDVNGITTVRGNILPEANSTRDIGSSSLKFKNIYATTIIDSIATRIGGSTIPFLQCMNNVQINSGQNVLWNHTTNEIPSTNFQLLIGTTSVGTTSERMQLSAYRDNSYRNLQLNPTGKVIIGGSSVIPTSTLDIGGDCTIRGDLLPDATALTRKIGSSSLKFNSGYFEVLYTTSGTVSTSDRNKKKDIQPIESALDMVLKLNPVSYKFIDGTSGRTHLGLIAQEVSEVIPDCAIFVKDENGSCGLRYDQFIALLIKAVQEQAENVKNLELRKPILFRQDAMSIDNSLYERVSNIEQKIERESIVEVKEEKSEQFELIQSLMDKVNFLVIKNQELENKIERLPKVEVKTEIQESDADGLSMIESLQERIYRAEQLINKQDKLIKKLVSATNKLIKGNE
jgi:hypothetical protein